jgi:hypothetical protein
MWRTPRRRGVDPPGSRSTAWLIAAGESEDVEFNEPQRAVT